MNNEIQIAKVLRPHGIKGALKISSSIEDIPFSKFNLVKVGANRELMHIKRVQNLNQFYVISLEEITSIEQAEQYRNQSIYVDRTLYEDVFEDIIFMSDFIGCKVIDENGKDVGIVVNAENFGSADIITINCGGTTYQVSYIKDTLYFDKEKEIFVIDSKRFLEIRV